MTLDVTITFNSCWNCLWSSGFHKQYYLHKPFTTHFIFYLFRALHHVAYSTYLLYSTYFLSFNNQLKKLKYCYSHLKSFVFMFWIVLFMFLNHLNIPHTPNPLFPSTFLLFFPNAFPNLFQILHCFMHHTPRQFRPSLSLSFFYFFFFFPHSLPVCI